MNGFPHIRFLGEPPTPPALADPGAPWIFNWVIPILGGAIIMLAIADSVRRRRLTWGFLFLINSTLCYWMETIGDWGQQLVYSPQFAEHHLLDWLPLKTPNDPLFMPFAYAVYWTVHAWIILKLGELLVRRFGWGLLRAIAVLALPVNYVWDFLVEATAAALGWWVYTPGFGPVIEFPNGGTFTVLWTIGLMTFWPNLIAYWAGKPPVRTLNHIERFLRLDRLTSPKRMDVDSTSVGALSRPRTPTSQVGDTVEAVAAPAAGKREEYDAFLDYEVAVPRWKFELARFGAWFVVFQVSFFVLLLVPLVIMRMITGHDSLYVP